MLFWNGNKSRVRQRYESELLQAVLDASREAFGDINLEIDFTDYPNAKDESDIFINGADLTVTVAGNPKFAEREKLIVDRPLAKGLLGKRILLIREEDQPAFASLSQEAELKAKVCGIPETWADVAIFAANKFQHLERGSFEEVFRRLMAREFDYVALGAFEIQDVFDTMARSVGGLVIEPSIMIQYPMPLVFYLHPDRMELAQQIHSGLATIEANGVLDSIFNKHFSVVLNNLSLEDRRVFQMENPLLPEI